MTERRLSAGGCLTQLPGWSGSGPAAVFPRCLRRRAVDDSRGARVRSGREEAERGPSRNGGRVWRGSTRTPEERRSGPRAVSLASSPPSPLRLRGEIALRCWLPSTLAPEHLCEGAAFSRRLCSGYTLVPVTYRALVRLCTLAQARRAQRFCKSGICKSEAVRKRTAGWAPGSRLEERTERINGRTNKHFTLSRRNESRS